MSKMLGGYSVVQKSLALLFCAFIVALDQFAKFLVDNFVRRGSSVNVISLFNFFNLTNIRNTGIEFGMFQGNNFLFSVIGLLLLSALLLYLYKFWNKSNKTQQFILCLIIAGGLGNFIDRVFRGAVIDFFDFGVNSKRWPSFNIADSCICIALCLIFVNMFVRKKQRV